MKSTKSTIVTNIFIFAVVISLAACSKDESQTNGVDAIVIEATGDINPKLEEFRALLGTQLNTTPGHTEGRREINWDGVPEELLNKKLPSNFFNPIGEQVNVANQRGLTYSTTGNFQVSKTNFAELNPGAADQFSSFSGDKSFANVSSSLWEVEFQVPAKTERAFVKGFGIVFSDVDLSQSTSLEFFNDDNSLGKYFVPAKSGSNFSFLGVYFKNEKVTRIKVQHNGELDKGQNDVTNGGPVDLITMDNFLYNEPLKR